MQLLWNLKIKKENMRILKATLKDLDFLHESCKKILNFEKSINPNISLNWVNWEEFKADIAKDLLLSDYIYFLLQKENKNIWFICWGYNEEKKWWNYKKIVTLDYIFIEENERWKWYSKKLIEKFENWGKNKWCDFIKLIAVPENKKALNLYKKLWFKVHLINIWKKL